MGSSVLKDRLKRWVKNMMGGWVFSGLALF